MHGILKSALTLMSSNSEHARKKENVSIKLDWIHGKINF